MSGYFYCFFAGGRCYFAGLNKKKRFLHSVGAGFFFLPFFPGRRKLTN